MKKIFKTAQSFMIKSVLLLFIAGSLFHFLYDISGQNSLVGLFTPVNESVWEHMKMVLLPTILLWSLYYLINGKKQHIDKNRWFTGALVALLVSLLTIPMLYYFYTQAFGVELLWVDIGILFVANLLGQLLGVHVYRYAKGLPWGISVGILVTIVLLFMVFTVSPPHLPIFMDESTGLYGMELS